MKKVGEYTVRGQLSGDGDPPFNRIDLFDGRFDTGYRITKFRIWPASWSTDTADSFAILFTDDGVSANAFLPDASDNSQIGWAANGTTVSEEITPEFTLIDRDNMVVQDLYISIRSDVGVNYYIEMDKYEFTDWQGALSMVRNRSQA
jgi:hypothetical protein